MTRARSAVWLQGLNLGRTEGGAAALERLEHLGTEERRDVLTFGERIAAESHGLAQAYLLRAPDARVRLGRSDFAAWARRGLAIAGEPLGNREAAAVYFRLEPAAVARAGELADQWIELAREVQAISRRLAVAFLDGSSSLLSRDGGQAAAELRSWAKSGIELGLGAGWRGEFLAGAFFDAGRNVLGELREAEIPLWAALGRKVQSGRDLDLDFFRSLPEAFAGLEPGERRCLFDLALEVSGTAPRVAREIFLRLPPALAPLAAQERRPLAIALAAAAEDAEEWLRVVPLLGAIVRSIPAAERPALFGRVARVAERFARCLAPLLRSLPRAREESDFAGIESWIAHGERLASDRLETARAFFALESRTGVNRLRAASPAVRIEEVEGVLRALARMLSGSSFKIRAGTGASLRAFLDPESLERTSLALPAAVNLFDSWEDNFLLLKLMTVNAVARLDHGTFDLRLPAVWERLPKELGQALAGVVPGATLADLFRALPEADPLIAIFTACEGARLDVELRRVHRGYDAELRRLARGMEAVSASGASTASVELVLFLLGAGTPLERLQHVAPELPAELIDLVRATLWSPAATVEDALALAILLRERLTDSVVISGFGPQATYEELLFEKLTGEAPIELEPEDAPYEGGRPRATEIVDVEPTKVEETDEDVGGTPLSAEELRRLLEAGAILKVGKGRGAESAGLFVTGSWIPEQAGALEDVGRAPEGAGAAASRGRRDVLEFEYDEWDYEIRDYRNRWCRLREIVIGGDSGEFFQQALARNSELLPEVRRQFQRIRPERTKRIRGLEDGEDFDLNAVIDARAELRARRSPSPRFYVARRREERDVATLFLLDMSASTDEPLAPPERGSRAEEGGWAAEPRPSERPRRIIDVTKEALVVMAEALDEIGDQYAIYGFSGEGRLGVEFYRVKHFQEGLSAGVRSRIGGIEPKRSTRMGAALRHAIAKMANLPSRSKHILLLSDGFPQDFDYGTDRRSNVYGIHDTMVAFQECEAAGITPFCITVDKTGHDYLRKICDGSRYMVIDEVEALPAELPKIYERWVQG